MDFGVTGKLGEYYLAQQYQKNRAAGKSEGVSFAEIAAAKAKHQGWGVTENSSLVKGAGSFSDVFPDYQVITKVGTGNVQQDLWERNDFPFDKYFDSSTTVDELNNWRPTAQEIVAKPWEISYCLVLDEEGEVRQSCVFGATGGKLIGPSEEEVRQLKAEQAAKKKRREEYARLNEEAALKRRLMEQETDAKYYQTSITKKTVSVYEQNIMEASDILK